MYSHPILDPTHRLVRFEHYSASWTAKPLLCLTCKCGTVVKAIFAGKTPISLKAMDESGFGHGHSYGSDYRLVAVREVGWSIDLRKHNYVSRGGAICPKCDRTIYSGASTELAVPKFIRAQLMCSDKARLVPSKVKALVDTIERNAQLRRFMQFQKDVVGNRAEACLVVGDDSAPREYKDVIKHLHLNYKDEPEWVIKGEKRNAHTELEDSILAAHGNDCACSLCRE